MRFTSYRVHLMAACAATILVVVLAGCVDGHSRSSQRGAQAPPAQVPSKNKLKTVRVFSHEPAPSPSPTDLRAGLEKGKLPHGTVEATVLTDENCAPDRRGISHCRNRLRLAGGGTVILRHPHDMNKVPCLTPGEKVLLRRA